VKLLIDKKQTNPQTNIPSLAEKRIYKSDTITIWTAPKVTGSLCVNQTRPNIKLGINEKE